MHGVLFNLVGGGCCCVLTDCAATRCLFTAGIRREGPFACVPSVETAQQSIVQQVCSVRVVLVLIYSAATAAVADGNVVCGSVLVMVCVKMPRMVAVLILLYLIDTMSCLTLTANCARQPALLCRLSFVVGCCFNV